MPVSLTSSDLAHLGEAVRLLVSPFDHGDVDGWRSAVLAHLRPLLGADSAALLLPAPGAPPFYSNEQDLDEINRYPDVPPPPPAGGVPALVRSAQLGVATLEMVYGDDLPAYERSVHYNEHAAPHRSHDTLAVSDLMGAGPASLHFWHGRPTGPRFGDREVALLRVLRPAFQAGTGSAVRWARQHGSLVDALDGLGQAAAVADVDGRLVHVTPGLEALLDAEPDPGALREGLRRTLRAVAGTARGDGVGAPPVRYVRTRSAAYDLRGCLYGGPVGPPLAVVAVAREAASGPSAADLEAWFGLTARQAEVALLLADRKSNREVAEALVISPHTARHHTEAVLRALGVADRRDVGPRIGRAARS